MKPFRKNALRRGRGAAAAELAIVLPILLLAILGMLEFGRAFMIEQILTNAAREGARRAIIPSTSNSDVTTLVDNYLVDASLGAKSRQVVILNSSGDKIADLRSVAPHSIVTIQVSVPHNEVGLIGAYLGGTTLSARCSMRKES